MDGGGGGSAGGYGAYVERGLARTDEASKRLTGRLGEHWVGFCWLTGFDAGTELNDVCAHLDFGNAEEDPVAAAVFDDQVRYGLGLARSHLRRGVHPIHRRGQSGRAHRNETQEAKSSAPARHVRFHEHKIVPSQDNTSLLVYVQPRSAALRTAHQGTYWGENGAPAHQQAREQK
jgi:hypothetical protein